MLAVAGRPAAAVARWRRAAADTSTGPAGRVLDLPGRAPEPRVGYGRPVGPHLIALRIPSFNSPAPYPPTQIPRAPSCFPATLLSRSPRSAAAEDDGAVRSVQPSKAPFAFSSRGRASTVLSHRDLHRAGGWAFTR
jgi:hypothetical protein